MVYGWYTDGIRVVYGWYTGCKWYMGGIRGKYGRYTYGKIFVCKVTHESPSLFSPCLVEKDHVFVQ